MRKKFFLFALTIISHNLFAQTKISVDSVNNHIGETVTICTQVFGVKSTATISFINLGAAYPNAPLTVVIFAKDSVNFKEPLSALYENKKICVTGILSLYKGKTQIVVSKRKEIEVD